MTSMYETIEHSGLSRMSHGHIPTQSSSLPRGTRPHTTTNATSSGNTYESSYLKKLIENPAPSIAKSSSFSSHMRAPQPTAMREPVPSPSHDTRHGGNTSFYHQSSNTFQKTFPTIQTNMSSHSSPRMPPSPAETINAILMEQTNSRSASPPSPRGPMPPRYSPLNNYNNNGRLRHSSPSPERLPSYTQTVMRKSSDENFARQYSMHRRSSSPPSNQYHSYDSESPPPKPLSPSHKDNIQNNIYPWASGKLPHEERIRTAQRSQTKYMPSSSYRQAPFWTQVSVKVSAALLKAGKDKKLAEAAQIAVVQSGEEQYSTDQEALNFVASRASLAVIEAGGDANTAAIASVACLQANSDIPSTEEQIKSEIERVMENMKSKASAVAQTTYDGGAKAVNVLSEFASRGIKDLQSFSTQSYRQYRIFQRRYMKERERAIRRLNDSYRDSRDDYKGGRDRSRGVSRRRSSSRATSRPRSSTSRTRTASRTRRSLSRARSPSRPRSSTSRARSPARPRSSTSRARSPARPRSSSRYASDDDSYEYNRRRRSLSKSSESESLSDSQFSESSYTSSSSTYTSSSESIKHSRQSTKISRRKSSAVAVERGRSGDSRYYRKSLSSSISR